MDRISTNEITLYGDEDPSQVNLKKVDFKLEQSNKVRGFYCKITIFDGSYCQLSIQNKHKKKIDYRVDLAYLDPRPARKQHIAWKWAIGAIGLALLSVSMIWVGWFSGWISSSVYYLTATVVTVSASLICLLLFGNNSYDKIVFHSQHGNVKLVELLNKSPDNNSFREFVSQFIVRIKSARVNKGLTPSKFLARELSELRRLRDEAVISAASYEAAKADIFKDESYQATNPRNLKNL